MRRITTEGMNLIKRFEGFSPVVYADVGGLPTIGYGHLLGSDEQWETMDEATATQILAQDVASAEQAVLRLVEVNLTDGQFDALVSFTFNLGAGAFQRSRLRRKINREEHGEVPCELMRWIYVNGSKIKGLIRIRQAEAMHYLS